MSGSPERRMLCAEFWRAVFACLDKLSKTERRSIAHEIRRRAQDTIADPAHRQRMRRLRPRIRELLREYGYEPFDGFEE
ncbi:MAG: hypothetical protein OZ928_20915 [Polyangiaceae bacterium]|nr:hypothetical protein [Polyangiaceae bacterium]